MPAAQIPHTLIAKHVTISLASFLMAIVEQYRHNCQGMRAELMTTSLVPLGLVALVIMGERASWLWLYGALIVACALGGAYGGATLRARTSSSDTPQ